MTNDPHKAIALEVQSLQGHANELAVEVRRLRDSTAGACRQLDGYAERLRQAILSRDIEGVAEIKKRVGVLRLRVDANNLRLEVAAETFTAILRQAQTLAAQMAEKGSHSHGK